MADTLRAWLETVDEEPLDATVLDWAAKELGRMDWVVRHDILGRWLFTRPELYRMLCAALSPFACPQRQHSCSQRCCPAA